MFTAAVSHDTSRMRWTTEKEKASGSSHPQSSIGPKETENREANSATTEEYAAIQANWRDWKAKGTVEARGSQVNATATRLTNQFKWPQKFILIFVFVCSFRARPTIQLSDEQKEYRALLQKDWARYQRQQHLELHRVCLRIRQSQEKALHELRAESEELYQAAIQADEFLLPITIKGPAYTPPIKNYEVPAEYLFPFFNQRTTRANEFFQHAAWNNHARSNINCVAMRTFAKCKRNVSTSSTCFTRRKNRSALMNNHNYNEREKKTKIPFHTPFFTLFRR